MKVAFLIWIKLSCLVSCSYATSFVEGALTGQLGNQLFVIAATVSLALDHDAEAIFPDFLHKQVDNIHFNFQNVFPRLKTASSSGNPCEFFYKEPGYSYSPIPYKPNMQISGYFQSEKYFAHHKQEIVKLFEPSTEIKEYLSAKYGHFLSFPFTVSLHLRSYFSHDPNNNVYPFHGHAYFQKAVSLFPEETIFLVFSNDMNLAKQELQGIPGNFYFIEGESVHHDFYLMSMCHHHIISNSSFSWWAAYLNQDPEKLVIAPAKWLTTRYEPNCNDVLPEDWVTLNY